MNKTNVDDMLLQMIEPKVRDIQEKFSRGEGLSTEDVNTLLLKSQYNHFNHLDEKLNEITADVASLKGEFGGLKGEFGGLKGEFGGLKGEFNELKGEFKLLETKVDARLSNFEANLKAFESNIEFKIQKAINGNMRWSIGLIALIVTVLKLIDVLASKMPNLF
ncbi:MAG: hypothetical protein ACKVOU_07490 [Cytophagales bacterium]